MREHERWASALESRWLILAILFLARTVMACQFQTVGSVGPVLVEALHIGYAQLGTLIGLYMLPGVVFALPGGLLGQRFGPKNVAVAGLVLMVAGGILTGAAAQFSLAVAGRLVSGVGAVLINVMLTKMVADWFKGAQVVTAMSLLIASWPLGIGVALLIYPQIATALGWPTVMNAAAFSALLALVAIGWIYRDPPDQASAAPRKFGVHLSKREWILASFTGAIWGTYNVGYIVLVSFAPEFFTTRGYSLERASSIVSLVGWLLIPSVPVSGYLVERLRRPDLLVFAGLGAVTIALAVLPSVSAPAALFFFIALLIGIPAGLIMALPANVLRSESLAAGMGVFYVWYYAEMSVLPGVAGAMRDLSGAAAAPILFAAAMMALASICLAGFRLATRASSSSQQT